MLQRIIEDIILLHASKEEDIVEAAFPRKKKVKEEVKTTLKEVVCFSFRTNVDNGSFVDLCSDTDF